MRHFSRNVIRNSAFGMAAQLVIKLLSFCFSVLIVRNLGVETYGQYVAVQAFWGMFIFVADLGLSPYAIRQVARWRDSADALDRTGALFGNMLALRFVLTLLASTLVLTAAWITGRPPVMIGGIALGSLIMICYSVQGTADSVLSGFERLDISARGRVINQAVFVLLGGGVLWLGIGYYGLIVASLIGVALMTRICWRGVKMLEVRARSMEIGGWPALLRASLPFGVIGFTLGLSYKFDSVLLNISRGDVETGYYNAAYSLIFSTVMLSNVINTALYPSLIRQAAAAPQSLAAIYERALRYLLVLALPIAVGVWALADQIVPFLFKATYLPAVPALQLLIWVVPLMFVSEFLGYVVVIAGDEQRVARAVLISTAFNVVLNLALVPRFGFISAAVMTVVTEAALVGQYVWLLRVQLRRIDWGQALLRPLFAALLMGGLVLALHALPLLLNIMMGALSYAALLLLLGVVGRDELHFVRKLRRPAEPEAVS